MTLTIKAKIKTVYAVTPRRISFTAYEGSGGEQKLTIKQSEGKPMKILKVEGDLKDLDYTLEPNKGVEIKGDEVYRMTLKVKPTVHKGNLRGNIVITTSIKDHPELKLPYYVRVTPIVSAIPDQVRMTIRTKPYQAKVMTDRCSITEKKDPASKVIHTAAKGTTLSIRQTEEGWFKVWIPGKGEGWVQAENVDPVYPGTTYAVTVSKHQGKTFEVHEVTTDIEVLKATLRPIQKGTSYQVLLNYTGPIVKGKRYTGTLKVETNDPTYSELKIPVNINVMDRQIRFPRPAPMQKKLGRQNGKQRPKITIKKK